MVNAQEIKDLLDNELKPKKLGVDFDEININAIKFFQKLFVEKLHFDLIKGQFGEVAEQILINNWNKAADVEEAFFIAQKDNFRIIYILIKKLTRLRERSTISSLKRERWALKGEYICIFYARNSDIWHMVCPHYTEGRTILRRYVLGEGENHRTVSENLILMDASLSEPLFDRVQDAFRVQVVTEEFYKRYKEMFQEIKKSIINQGFNIPQAKKFAHLLLNRLMFIYFIQKKGWINNDKNFLFNYLKMYIKSGEKNQFYEKWLKTLFFEAMSKPNSERYINEFEDNVNKILNNIPFLNGGLFEEDSIDKLKIFLPDNLIFTIIENFLEEYNFTITEESPFDLEIAIDPAMLGKIYESLIAEEERGKAGIFYTPRIEVDFMCRLAILEYFLKDKKKIFPKIEREKLKKNLIIFIFTPIGELDENLKEEFGFIRKALNNIKIIDPACGSGAFLVGMMQLLIELYLKLGVKIDYDLKEDIIYNTLYGVDIKDWAVRMAEFRLWLALIESEEKIPKKDPILPNFSFKLYCGDSLIQKLGDIDIDSLNLNKALSQKIKDEFLEISRLKKDYFKGKRELYNKIKNLQISIIIEDIKNQIRILEQKIKKKAQKDLLGDVTKDSLSEKEKLEEQLKEYKIILSNLKKKEIYEKFFWNLSFPEIMLGEGFDIVIGNPPYIRQEKIYDQSIDPELLENMSKSQLDELRKEYKINLENYVKRNFNLKTGKTCDLYVYFYFKSIELLNNKGLFILITSNTWLDSNFGKILQEGLLKFSHLKYIINNQIKRSFEQADINTIIVLGRSKIEKGLLKGNINFLTLNNSFESFNNPNLMYEILLPGNKEFKKINYFEQNLFLLSSENYRIIRISELALWKIGGGINKTIQTRLDSKISIKKFFAVGEYNASKWSKFLRAPEIFFKIIEKSRNNFIKIGNILKRGYTTGANEFFYLPLPIPGKKNKYFRSEIDKKNGNLNLFLISKKDLHLFKEFIDNENLPIFSIEKKYWMRKYNKKYEKFFNLKIYFDNDEFFYTPNYLIKSPKELENLIIFPNDLNFLVLHINEDKDELLPGIRKYIKWGESMGFHTKPTCSSRTNWYDLGKKIRYKIVCIIDIDKRYVFSYNKFRFDIDARLYGIEFEESNKLNFLFLKSNLYPLLMELEGRVGLGDGALDVKVCDYENLIIPNTNLIEKIDNKKIKLLMNNILEKELKNDSIFKIIGTEIPEQVDLRNIQKEIREIDKLLFEDLLELSESEQLEIYKNIISLVKARLSRAKSV
ncbi:MAG: Eco57I restriction-modification methylase domain-containing protein [Candidatus Helarchaeota archaeon]